MKTATLVGVGILSSMLSAATIAAPPQITSFSPTSGPVGTIVTIAGSDFNTTASNNVVFFGATSGTVMSASSTSLTVSVPVGASYAPMSVTDTTTGLTAYSSGPFIVTFPGGGSITASSFANPIDFSTAFNPYFVAVADIDGDGKPDVVIAERGGLVSIFRNTSTIGSISLANRVDFAEGGTPHNIRIGDIDGDGRPDLVVPTDSMISVFRNTSTSGSISLASRVDFKTAYNTTDVAIGDVDGDGRPDLVASAITPGSISVLRNTSTRGSISMASRIEFGTDSTWSPSEVALADIDGDGKPDVVVVTILIQWSRRISVLRNTSTSGSLSFADKVDHSMPTYVESSPSGLRIADLDDDGKPDLIVASPGGDRIMAFRNTSTSGSISWLLQDSCLLPISSNPNFTAVADVDGDGQPDLAATTDYSSVSIIRNTSANGNMSFASPVSFAAGLGPKDIAIVDIDGDGAPDIVVPHWDSGVSLLRNTVMPDAVPDIGSKIPTRFDLSQNYPNPFNPTTNIRFTIVNRQLTIVKVYDVLGREVATLVDEVKEPGTYTVQFSGSGLASGVYFYKLTAGNYLATHTMILMR